jgi:hypothetical protein
MRLTLENRYIINILCLQCNLVKTLPRNVRVWTNTEKNSSSQLIDWWQHVFAIIQSNFIINVQGVSPVSSIIVVKSVF